MSDKYYSKISHIANALSDIESIESRIEIDVTLEKACLKVVYIADNLTLAGFSSDYLMTLSNKIRKAVKKALLKTKRILLSELEEELESVKDSLTAEED